MGGPRRGCSGSRATSWWTASGSIRTSSTGHLQDKKLHFNGNAALRGGWNVGAGYFVESFGYDSALYAGYRLEVPRAGGGGGLDTVAFTAEGVTERLRNTLS